VVETRDKIIYTLKILNFQGDDKDGPNYFLQYCEHVCAVDLPPNDCVYVMLYSTAASAHEWVTDTIHAKQSTAPANVLAELILEFKNHYMGIVQIHKFKKYLESLKLMSLTTKVKVSELKEHFGLFTKYKRWLMTCDLTETEQSMKERFVNSLPQTLQMIATPLKHTKSTVDELYSAVEEMVAVNDKVTGSTSAAAADTIVPVARRSRSLHNNYYEYQHSNDQSSSSGIQSRDSNKINYDYIYITTV
jgi:hypothetical protein